MEYEAPAKPIEQPEAAAYRKCRRSLRGRHSRGSRKQRRDSRTSTRTCAASAGAKVSNGVVRYSQQQYGRTLCMACQRKQGGNQ